MDEKEIEEKLGISPGPTLLALVALAEKTSPGAPWDAFAPLWLLLPWLKPGGTAAKLKCLTPENVHPFAESGGDCHHFGFLMDRELATDERPIVYVDPGDYGVTHVVAPNLRGFLGLVAVSFAEVVSRGATDAEWSSFRSEWYGDYPERLEEMERLSVLLCTLPGVSRPASPSKIANEAPDQPLFLQGELEDA